MATMAVRALEPVGLSRVWVSPQQVRPLSNSLLDQVLKDLLRVPRLLRLPNRWPFVVLLLRVPLQVYCTGRGDIAGNQYEENQQYDLGSIAALAPLYGALGFLALR